MYYRVAYVQISTGYAGWSLCYKGLRWTGFSGKLHILSPRPLVSGFSPGSSLWDHFVYVLRQWETTLHCNAVSHCLSTYTKWSLYMCQANERRRYIVTLSLIGWAHTQNYPSTGSMKCWYWDVNTPSFNRTRSTVSGFDKVHVIGKWWIKDVHLHLPTSRGYLRTLSHTAAMVISKV